MNRPLTDKERETLRNQAPVPVRQTKAVSTQEEWEWVKTLVESTNLQDRELLVAKFQVERARVRQETIEECKRAVPAEKITVVSLQMTYEMGRRHGFNACREATLTALDKLTSDTK